MVQTTARICQKWHRGVKALAEAKRARLTKLYRDTSDGEVSQLAVLDFHFLSLENLVLWRRLGSLKLQFLCWHPSFWYNLWLRMVQDAYSRTKLINIAQPFSAL